MKKIKKMLLLGCLLTSFVQSATSCSSYDLVVFNWGEYIDNNVIYAFEDKYGVSVKYLTFDSNESMMQKLSGGARYDVVFPSDYAVEEMASKDLIEELDYSKFEYYKGEKDLVDLLKDSIKLSNQANENFIIKLPNLCSVSDYINNVQYVVSESSFYNKNTTEDIISDSLKNYIDSSNKGSESIK